MAIYNINIFCTKQKSRLKLKDLQSVTAKFLILFQEKFNMYIFVYYDLKPVQYLFKFNEFYFRNSEQSLGKMNKIYMKQQIFVQLSFLMTTIYIESQTRF